MGYNTDFNGVVEIEPPLNEHEVSFLEDFRETRRMHRSNGPLFVKGSGTMGQGGDPDILAFNNPDPDQPGLWCQWEVSEEGTFLEWDGGEKFYNASEWMAYLVECLLAPSAKQYVSDHLGEDERLKHFTCDHVLNGEIEAQGEDPNDRWTLVVRNNLVTVAGFKHVTGAGSPVHSGLVPAATVLPVRPFEEVAQAQGWNDASRQSVIEGFIAEQGLSEALAQHAELVAAEENS